MHKLITGYAQTDHRNHNGLDNRRSNLREATTTQNQANKPKSTRKKYSSQYKGVVHNKKRRRWYAQISVNGKTEYIGSFINAIDAAREYDRVAYELHGEFACLNFPK